MSNHPDAVRDGRHLMNHADARTPATTLPATYGMRLLRPKPPQSPRFTVLGLFLHVEREGRTYTLAFDDILVASMHDYTGRLVVGVDSVKVEERLDQEDMGRVEKGCA